MTTIRRYAGRSSIAAALCLLCLAAAAQAGKPADADTEAHGEEARPTAAFDLTGVWEDERGVRYWVRQIDTSVFWYMDKRPEVFNVFHGTVDGDSIQGKWADLPLGRIQRGGRLTLRVESSDRFVQVQSIPAIYTGSVWNRLRPEGEALGPGPQQRVDFTGSWSVDDSHITHGMDLQQDGNRVTGTYDVQDGVIEGTVEGRVLTFTWLQRGDDHSGRGEFVLSDDGKSFKGRWWREKPDHEEGPWKGTRLNADFTGGWTVDDSYVIHGMDLQQDGNRVTGTYDVRDGVIEGMVDGRKLIFTWHQRGDDHSGRGELVLSDDGKSFRGRWWREKPDALEGPWTGTRK